MNVETNRDMEPSPHQEVSAPAPEGSTKISKIRNAVRRLTFRPEIIYDRSKALDAVRADGENLEYVSKALQDDPDVVLEAVKKDGLALRFASPRLRDDEVTVLAAVTNNGEALEFASKRLQASIDVALVAVGQNGRAARFVAQELWSNPTLIELGNKTYKHRMKERN